MYEQKTVVSNSIEELDSKINELYKQNYLFTGAPTYSDKKYMQTVVKLIDNR